MRKALQRALIFENVQGPTRAAFADYFDYILLQLDFPSLVAKQKEQWGNHQPACTNGRTSREPPACTA